MNKNHVKALVESKKSKRSRVFPAYINDFQETDGHFKDKFECNMFDNGGVCGLGQTYYNFNGVS